MEQFLIKLISLSLSVADQTADRDFEVTVPAGAH
jgi:hypothetical protein